MKRTIALVLTLLFVLTMIPVTQSASADVTPLSIAINTKPTTRVYKVGETFDLGGLTIDYYDGVQQDVADTLEYATDYVTSDPATGQFTTSYTDGHTFTSDDVGDKTVTVTYNAGTPAGHTHVEKPTTTFVITVVSTETGYLNGLTIETNPSNLVYYEGEIFDSSGLSLRASYTNGSDPDVSLSDCTFSLATDHPLTLADSYVSGPPTTGGVTVTYSKAYTAQTLTASAVVEITVKTALSSINIDATTLTLSFAYSDIAAGTKKQVVCNPALDATTFDAVTWGSSNPDVVTVDGEGYVTAVAPGSAIVTVTTRGTNKQAICAVTVEDNVVPITNFILNKTELTMGYVSPESGVPATEQLEVTYSPSNTTQTGISWASDTPLVATVNNYGVVTAVGAGTATITATSTVDSSLVATCDVTVIDINVDSITISQDTATLYAGSSLTLDAYVLPLNASNPTITWGTSDATKATVVDGVVTTIYNSATTYPCTVVITATAGSYSSSCTITLKSSVQLTEVNLNKTSASMSVGDTMALVASTAPSNATNKTLKWTSSNTAVATVDSAGKVTALAAGNTTIVVAATDGSGYSASCNISVSTVNVLIVSMSTTSLSLVEGNSSALTATVYPSNATNPTLQWSSSNTSIATVDSTGKVTARNVTGYAIITASATDGSGKFAECVVIAKAKVAVTGITLNYGTSLDLLLGDSTTLKATVLPSTATNPDVTWSSSNTSVATIDANGLLSSVALGETTITATADGKSVTMVVTVTNSEYNYGVAANFRRRVNVRASASGLSKLVGYAYLGDTFRILGKTGNWYYIQYNNTTKAYIWASYLNASKTSSGYTAVSTSSSSSSSTTTTTTPTTVTITNCLYAVNVRSGASTTNERIGKAKLGATYTYLGVEGDWYKIQYTTTTVGYVYGTFVSLS